MSLPIPFLETVERLIPRERRFDDPLSTLAFGTDASFYRLIPKLVLRVESEDEVAAILSAAYREQVPVTFRAAGTSLSGQAISDSVLLVLGDNWNGREIRADGAQIRLQPGVIGAQANAWLAPFGRKIGPDPASINACKIGGIVANNASGMCCGTAQNSYHTLAGLRLLLADGTRLDPAEVRPDGPDPCRVQVVLHQGVYHQIKRMFGVYGAGVNELHRLAIGPVALDPALAPGRWRPLTDAELAALRRSAGRP